MALFAIADLHLSSVSGKPMDKFGPRWTGYMEKIHKKWNAVVSAGDTVIIPGDISWAMSLKEAEQDLRFIDSLPGNKILIRGNHDYWWSSVKKINDTIKALGLESIKIIQNNSLEAESCIVCGSRGWFTDRKLQTQEENHDYDKIVMREVQRIRLSGTEATRMFLKANKPVIAFLHFPPVYGEFVCRPIVDVLHECGISRCFYGHIHGDYYIKPSFEYENIKFEIVSADYLEFTPKKIIIEEPSTVTDIQ